MNKLFKSLYFVVFLIWVVNIILFAVFSGSFVSTGIFFKYMILIIIFFAESIIIIYLIKRFYEAPILEIESAIWKFINGELKWKDIRVENSENPHLNTIIKFFNVILNSLKSIKDEFLHGREIKSEVDLWKEIQWQMLSKKLIEIPSLNVIAKSKPAAEIGWDSYDIIKQWDNYYIYVWDATGHWVWAWFIMIMVNALVSWFSKLFISWAQILSNTNEILKPRVKANLLMSMLLVRWDELNKKLYMTGAWHEYLLIYKHNKKKCFKVKSGWVALWMIKDAHKLLQEKRVQFEENDIIVLYSDWVSEAINRPFKNWEEKMFWEDNIIEAIEKAPELYWSWYKSAMSVFNNITINLSKFMWYKHVQLDDITLVVIQYKSANYEKEKDVESLIPNEVLTEWHWDKKTDIANK